MKPEQFIREFGLKKAKALCEGAPENANVYDIDNNEYADTREDTFGLSCNLIGLRRLSHLVGSMDIVRVIGGIEYARSVVANAPAEAIGYDTMYEGYFGEKTKHYYKNLRTFTIDQIKEAVAIHESIYGGGDEVN